LVKEEDRLLKICSSYFSQLKNILVCTAYSVPVSNEYRSKFTKDIEKMVDSTNSIFTSSFEQLSEIEDKTEGKNTDNNFTEMKKTNVFTKSNINNLANLLVDSTTGKPKVFKSFQELINEVKRETA
jgi:hypothetical protein